MARRARRRERRQGQRQERRQETRKALRRDVRQAVKDKDLSRKEGKQLRSTYGRRASQRVARVLARGKGVEMTRKAGKPLGLRYNTKQNRVTFDPRAFSKKKTNWVETGAGVGDGSSSRWEKQTSWQHRMNAPGKGKGWYVSGYRKGKDGKDIPIYTFGGKALKPGKNRNRNRGESEAPAPEPPGVEPAPSWQSQAAESYDPLEDMIWQQAQDSLNQMDYFDQMLADMMGMIGGIGSGIDPLYGADALAATGPGVGYAVNVSGPGGAENTYYTNPVGRRLPEASTLTVPLA